MRIFASRQDDISNALVPNSRIEYGWGVMTMTTSTNTYFETVTFSLAFTNKPIVLITAGGDTTNSSTVYGSGANNNQAQWYAKAESITASTFEARLITQATPGAVGTVFYQWIAIGL